MESRRQTLPKITQRLADMEVESRSNALQHRPGFLGCVPQQAESDQRGISIGVGIERARAEQEQESTTRTRLCAPGVRQEHPRHNLIGHPLPKSIQHRLIPLPCARL